MELREQNDYEMRFPPMSDLKVTYNNNNNNNNNNKGEELLLKILFHKVSLSLRILQHLLFFRHYFMEPSYKHLFVKSRPII
jgi:hypothetical protein